MTEKLVPGTGTCQVSMINTGWLSLSPQNKWIVTENRQCVPMPVMCFVIEKDGKVYLWDLGIPEDFSVINDTVRTAFGSLKPVALAPLPASLTPAQRGNLEAVYLSHYHCGDVRTVRRNVPVYVGPGTLAAINGDRREEFNIFIGDLGADALSHLSEVEGSKVQVGPFPNKGFDVFGDGSFVVVPAPGPSTAPVIVSLLPELRALRTLVSRDRLMVCYHPLTTDIIMGGDSGHNRALYAPCPCHHAVAMLPKGFRIHWDEPVARRNLDCLTELQARDDVWVLLAHESEAIGIVPERTDLGQWRSEGWKTMVEERMGAERRKKCYAEENVE